jgi:imidazoleglycerol-phosphate dehydratase
MRTAEVERKTLETEIKINLSLDGTGIKKINTGVKFFDHMLEQLASHGYFDLEIQANSLDKDQHHVVEDTALALGEAFRKAVGNKKGINRYGNAVIPMDESLAMTTIDISGRPYCGFTATIGEELVSEFETAMVKHFFVSFSTAAMMTVHIRLLDGEDPHHKIEAIFKSFARALNTACSINQTHSDLLPSTKGVL